MLTVEHLWRQSMMTAHDLMRNAKDDIDQVFGEGYATAHPALVVAYMHAANYDLRSMLEHLDREAARGLVSEAVMELSADYFVKKEIK